MSLWTPSGEHPVGRDQPDERAGGRSEGGVGAPANERATPGAGHGARIPGADEGGSADADVDALRRELAEAPADVVVANHCYGLFELAAVYLSGSPPHLDDARLAIDALGFVVDGLGERLGEAHPSLRDALAQIRLAFVQIAAAQETSPGNGAGSP
ncbi:MAG: hypothetical protein M0Z40_11940 [Actinomycetota bacterium]|nr:hypothetical protein [Actinomycetota bacterium]